MGKHYGRLDLDERTRIQAQQPSQGWLQAGLGEPDRDGAASLFHRFTPRLPFIAKTCGDGPYQGPFVQTESPRSIKIVKRTFA